MTGRAVILYTAMTGEDSIESRVRELETLGIQVLISQDIGHTDPTLFDANAGSFHYHAEGITKYVQNEIQQYARFRKSA